MNSLEIYKSYFKIVRCFGWAPYEIVSSGNGDLVARPIYEGFGYWLFSFNVLYSVSMIVKNCVVTGSTLVSTDSQLLDLLLQLMYLVGSLMIATLCFNHLWYATETAHFVTVLIKMDAEWNQGLRADGATALNDSQPSLWIKILVLAVKSIPTIWCSCFLVASILNYIFPRLAYFSYSLAPFDVDELFCHPSFSCFYLPLIQLSIVWPDVYLLPWAWVGMFSFDILMITISSQIGHFTTEMDRRGTAEEKVIFLKQVDILMKHMNGAYANCLITHSALSTICLLILLYGSIRSKESLFLFGYFLANSVVLSARAVFLIMLLATLDSKSKALLGNAVIGENGSAFDIKLRKMEILCVRSVCMTSGGIYKIDNDCGFNYINFLLNYILFVIKV